MKRRWSFATTRILLVLAMGAGFASCNTETPARFDPEELALVRVEPADGESSVPRNQVIRMTFNTNVLPESVTDQSLIIRTGGQFTTRPDGTFLISGNIVEFDPTLTAIGSPNAIGFEAGVQVLVEIPLKIPDDGAPANDFLQNVEGNPITIASDDNVVSFTTGSGWNDPVPGPPGVLGLSFTPGPNSVGQVAANAAVTVIFDEPVNPSSVILGQNIFLTQNTDTAPNFQEGIPSVTFFDGSLTRFTFLPVFGFGQGPFSILVNFIDPESPDNFSPDLLPTDLAGNRVQNFTFFQSFDTEFDPTQVNTDVHTETFETAEKRGFGTTALWGDDPDFPFQLVSPPITTRIATADVLAIVAGGGGTDIDNAPVAVPPGSNPGPEDFCPGANPLLGPDLTVGNLQPPTSDGRRQQNLYRQSELGARGTIIRAAWGPDSDALFAATYTRVNIKMGHKAAGTALAPGGFDGQFDVDGFVRVVNNATYTVPQVADVNGPPINNGWFDWPELDTFFDFDGVNDFIIDVEAEEGNTFQVFREFWALAQVSGFATCNCATALTGSCNPANTIGLRQHDTVHGSDTPNPPNGAGFGSVINPGPFVKLQQFELATLVATANSLYYDAETPDPDYLAPIITPLVQDGGATIQIMWAGSTDGVTTDVGPTSIIDEIDGFQFLRFEIQLVSNFFTGARARIGVLQVPFLFDF